MSNPQPPPSPFVYRVRARMLEVATEELEKASRGEAPPPSDIEIVVRTLAAQVREFEIEWDALWKRLDRRPMPSQFVRPCVEAAQRLHRSAQSLLERLIASGEPFKHEFVGMANTLAKIEPQINDLLGVINAPVVIDSERIKAGLKWKMLPTSFSASRQAERRSHGRPLEPSGKDCDQ